jgi:ElaB/YqjD/DUF883 family membrane-anchored ribosome-binding protein
MTTAHEDLPGGEEPRSSSEIESDIRRTRGRMDATLDELGDRLSARSLLNSALDWWEQRSAGTPSAVGAKTKNAYRAVARQVKGHPGPALLIGAGITWLIMDAAAEDEDERETYPGAAGAAAYGGYSSRSTGAMSGSTATSEYGFSEAEAAGGESESGPGLADKARDMAGQAKSAVAGAADTVREKVAGLGDAAQGVAESVGQRAQQAYEQGRSVSRRVGGSLQSGYRSGAEQFQDAVEEYPLAVGIGFAALGALVGLLLPRTRGEDELLGERSDRLVKTVKEAGKETLERGKAVVERIAETTASEAQKQGLTGEAVSGGISELAAKAGEVLRKAKEEAGAAAEEEKLIPQQLQSEITPESKGTKDTGGSQQEAQQSSRGGSSPPAT